MFTLGKGATNSYLRKVKLNTRSLTEMELLTADMYMPEMLWSLYFIHNQGYKPECMGLYQDNIRTQLLIKNEKFSSGKKTKHVKAKFFFIKDRVDNGEIKVIDCPVEEMWADILTKPLQGMAFQTMRAQFMNCLINYEDPSDEPTKQLTRKSVVAKRLVTWGGTKQVPSRTPQDCVGKNRSNPPSHTADRRIGIARNPARLGKGGRQQTTRKQ
jgi:hypothetical protein